MSKPSAISGLFHARQMVSFIPAGLPDCHRTFTCGPYVNAGILTAPVPRVMAAVSAGVEIVLATLEPGGWRVNGLEGAPLFPRVLFRPADQPGLLQSMRALFSPPDESADVNRGDAALRKLLDENPALFFELLAKLEVANYAR